MRGPCSDLLPMLPIVQALPRNLPNSYRAIGIPVTLVTNSKKRGFFNGQRYSGQNGMSKPRTYSEMLWLAVLTRAPSYIRQTGEQATRVEMAAPNWLIVTLPSELKALAMSRPDRKEEIEQLLKSESGRYIQISYRFNQQRGKR